MELSTLFDLKQLEAIRLVAEEKHFGRAAARAFVSPGTMSTRVKDFEDAVGYAVFHRTSRSVELTDRGAELIVLLEGPMRQLQEIFADGAGLDGKDVEISIATSSDTDRNNILAAINRLRTVYGAVRTERVGDKDLPQLFADESIHAAISWSTLDDLGLDTDDYVSGRLASDPKVTAPGFQSRASAIDAWECWWATSCGSCPELRRNCMMTS